MKALSRHDKVDGLPNFTLRAGLIWFIFLAMCVPRWEFSSSKRHFDNLLSPLWDRGWISEDSTVNRHARLTPVLGGVDELTHPVWEGFPQSSHDD